MFYGFDNKIALPYFKIKLLAICHHIFFLIFRMMVTTFAGEFNGLLEIETLLNKSIVGSLGPEPARCMTSRRREPTSYSYFCRTTKFSSNRHRKLQPFRET